MLSLIHQVAGRPWAIRGEIAAHVHGLIAAATRRPLAEMPPTFAELRHFARLKTEGHRADRLRAAWDHDDDEDNRPRGRRGTRPDASGTIAVIPLLGTMTQRGDVINSVATQSTAELAEEIRAAAVEPKVDAIVLEVDSPGGEVFGVPEAWASIRESEKLKPIVAHANSVMASAALYVSSPATEIWVTPSGEVGSLGVYALHINAAKAIEDMGEEWEFIEADDSPYKVEGNPAGPLTDEGRAQIKKAVNRYMGMFVRDEARGRGVSVDHVREHFGKGRMLSPQEALAAKMIDQVGTLEQAIRRAAQLARERREGAPSRAASAETPAPPPAPPVEAPKPAAELPAEPPVDTGRAAAAAMLKTL